MDGGGPAGVVDGFPNKAKVPGALLVGVVAPNGADVDVEEPTLPNRLLPPVLLAPPSSVAGDVGGCPL